MKSNCTQQKIFLLLLFYTTICGWTVFAQSTLSMGTVAATVNSINNTTPGVKVFEFTVTDVADASNTKFTQIIVNQGIGNDVSDWTQVIDGAILASGSDQVTATVNTTNLTFSGIDDTTLGFVSDGTAKTFEVRLWLKSSLNPTLKATIDGLNLVFRIQAVSFTMTESTINPLEDINTGAGNIAVSVIATKISFITQPSPTFLGVTAVFATPPIAQAEDANGNRDLNYGAVASVTNIGGLSMINVPTTFSAGLLTFPTNFYYDNAGNGTLTVTSGMLTAATSNPVTVTSASVTAPTLNVCANSGYSTLGNIDIVENGYGDFEEGFTMALILNAPTNFEFEPSVGTVSKVQGANLSSSPFMIVSSTSVVIFYTVVGKSGTSSADLDHLRISGLRIRATSPSGVQTITRDNLSSAVVYGVTASTSFGNVSANNPAVILSTNTLTSPPYCGLTPITLVAKISGGASNGTWTKIAGAGSLGATIYDTGTDTWRANYTPLVADYGNTVTFQFTTDDPPGSCIAVSQNLSFIIHAPASATFLPSTPMRNLTNVCSEGLGYIYEMSEPSSTYTWTISGAGNIQVTGGNSHSITVNWGNTSGGSFTVTAIETTSNGCIGTPQVLNITMPTPVAVSFSMSTTSFMTSSPDYILNDEATYLPTGGVFSGNYVYYNPSTMKYYFRPADAMSGYSGTITYTVTSSGCTYSKSVTVTVIDAFSCFEGMPFYNMCVAANTPNLTGIYYSGGTSYTSIQGYKWGPGLIPLPSGSFIPDGFHSPGRPKYILKPSMLDDNSDYVFYAIGVTGTPCTYTFQWFRTYKNTLNFSASYNSSTREYCSNDTDVTLTGTSSDSGTNLTYYCPDCGIAGFSDLGNGEAIFRPGLAYANAGNSTDPYDFYITMAKNDSCGTITKRFRVYPRPPQPALSSSIPDYCNGDVLGSISVTGFTGAFWEWSNSASFSPITFSENVAGNTSTFNNPITLSAPGPLPSTLSYWVRHTKNGCTSLARQINITIYPTPATPLLISTVPTYCHGNTMGNITVQGNTGAIWEWSTVSNFATILSNGTTLGNQNTLDGSLAGTLSAPGPGSTTYTFYVRQRLNGCYSQPLAVNVLVFPIPVLPELVNPIPNYCAGNTLGSITVRGTTGATWEWATANTFAPSTLITTHTTSGDRNTLNHSPTLSVGTLQLYVRQTVNGCTSPTLTVTIHTYANPIANAGVSQQTCIGRNITLGVPGGTATGGEPPYTYSWTPAIGLSNPNTETPTLVPFAPGLYSYTVTVKDNKGCESSSSVLVDVKTALVADAGANKEICPNGTTSIGGTPSATGGNGVYTYAWTPATGLSSTTVSNPTVSLMSGSITYTLTVTDGIGCSSSDQVIVMVNPNPVAQAGSDKEICADQSIILGGTPTAFGGSGSGYTYLWSPATGLNNTSFPNPILTLSTTGTFTYTVTVIDSKGCTATDDVVITVNSRPVANAGSDLELCAGSSAVIGTPGTVATGGTPPYTYSWTPAFGLSDALAETPTFTLPAPGIYFYTVTVTDSKGCTSSDAVRLDVRMVPIARAGSDKEICSGSSTVIGDTPAVIGGTPPYTYDWSPSIGLNDPTVPNPIVTLTSSQGTQTYRLTVVDSKGCISGDDVKVTVNQLPTVQAGLDREICAGVPTSLGGSPTAFGGAGGYSYNWTPAFGLSSTISANPELTLTIPGVYQYILTVTDVKGCVMKDTVNILVNPNPIANAGADTEVCMGESVKLGGAVAASGGTGPTYTYKWTPATGLDKDDVPNPNLTISVPGVYTYTLEVTDTKGCKSSDQIAVQIHNKPIASAGEDKKICSGSSTILGGSPTASGGSGTGYTYVWSPTTGLDNPNIANPQVSRTDAGVYVYKITVTDSKGCSSTDEMSLTVFALPVANAGPDARVCATLPLVIGGNPTAVGGSGGGYSYKWTPETGLSNPFGANPTMIQSIPGVYLYDLEVTDGNGCKAYDQVRVVVNELPIADAGPDRTVCARSPILLGGVQTARGGSGGQYTYSWTPVERLSNPAVANPIFNSEEAGNFTYQVLITDQKGCQARDTVSVRVLRLPIADAGPDKEVCEGRTVVIGGNPTASGGSGSNYTYFWTPFTGLDDPTKPNPVVSLTLAQKTVTYTLLVTDGNGCSATDQVTVTVNPLPKVSISGFNAQLQYCIDAPDVRLQGIANSPGNGFFKGQGIIENSTIFSPSLAGVGGPYPITFVFTNDKGCVDSVVVNIRVVPLPNPDFGGLNASREYCIDYKEDIILTGIPAGVGGVFSGNGITNIEGEPGKAIFRVSAAAAIANTPDVPSFHVITYTYTDANGCTRSVSKTLKINPLPRVGITGLKDNYCITDVPTLITGNPLNPRGRFSGPGIIDHGNGTATIDPSKVGREGDITVTYSVTNEKGCTNAISLRTRVWARPGTRITNFTELGLSTRFCNNASPVRLIGDPVGGSFSINGILIGPDFNPANLAPGIYNLGYSYANAFGCDSIFLRQIVILPLPEVKFSYSSSCEKLKIKFTNETFFKETVTGFPNSIAATEWDFGDNTTSTLNNPEHTYVKEGIYKVRLTVTSIHGCRVSLVQDLVIGQTPTVNFTWLDICLGTTVKFKSSGTFGSLSTPKQWEWDFGDGTTKIVTGNKGDTEHVYKQFGTYNVKLTAVSDKDCRKDTTLKVSITPIIAQYPYVQTFTENSGGWFASSVGSSWQLGTPSEKSTIKPKEKDDKIWMTNLNGPYLDKEKSYVYSPCFNLQALQRPMVMFKYWSATAAGIDGATLEVTTDDVNWTRLGRRGSGMNWYNGASLPGNPGNQLVEQLGWTGVETSWKEARHSLEAYRNASFVRFRFAFGAIDNSGKLDGFAFDDFWVGEREKIALIEHFTNVGAATSIQDQERLDRIANNLPSDLVIINYHTDFPNNNDPVNLLNKAEPSARALYYGILQTPRTVLDGNDYKGVTSGLNANNVDTLSLEPVKIELSTDFSQTVSSKFILKVGIKSKTDFTAQRLKLYVAVVNRTLNIEGNTYRNILNRMVPNHTGTTLPITWKKGEIKEYTLDWGAFSNRDINNIQVVVFVQDDVTKDILQTLVRIPDKFPQVVTGLDEESSLEKLVVYPNPTNYVLSVKTNEGSKEDRSWTITDVSGKVWLYGTVAKGTDSWEVEVSTLPTGVYILQVFSDGKMYAYRQFAVQH